MLYNIIKDIEPKIFNFLREYGFCCSLAKFGACNNLNALEQRTEFKLVRHSEIFKDILKYPKRLFPKFNLI